MIATGIQPLSVPSSAVPANPSSELELALNLDATQPLPAQPFDAQSPETTASFGTSLQIFDSLGAPHSLDMPAEPVRAPVLVRLTRVRGRVRRLGRCSTLGSRAGTPQQGAAGRTAPDMPA